MPALSDAPAARDMLFPRGDHSNPVAPFPWEAEARMAIRQWATLIASLMPLTGTDPAPWPAGVTSAPERYYVAPGGSDTNPGSAGSPSGPYRRQRRWQDRATRLWCGPAPIPAAAAWSPSAEAVSPATPSPSFPSGAGAPFWTAGIRVSWHGTSTPAWVTSGSRGSRSGTYGSTDSIFMAAGCTTSRSSGTTCITSGATAPTRAMVEPAPPSEPVPGG